MIFYIWKSFFEELFAFVFSVAISELLLEDVKYFYLDCEFDADFLGFLML